MVVDLDDRSTNELFHALADPTRRDILVQAMRGDQSVSTLASRYPMSFAAVQKHVAVLERAGLVAKQKNGRERLVRTEIETIRLAARLLDEIEEMWRHRLDRFGDVLAETDEGETT